MEIGEALVNRILLVADKNKITAARAAPWRNGEREKFPLHSNELCLTVNPTSSNFTHNAQSFLLRQRLQPNLRVLFSFSVRRVRALQHMYFCVRTMQAYRCRDDATVADIYSLRALKIFFSVRVLLSERELELRISC